MSKKYSFSMIGNGNEDEIRRLIEEVLCDSCGVEINGNCVTINDLGDAFRFRMRADETLSFEKVEAC